MRSGNATEAELEFKQMTLSYPRLATPFVNLGILYRKSGHLDQSEDALKGAVERNGTSLIYHLNLSILEEALSGFLSLRSTKK